MSKTLLHTPSSFWHPSYRLPSAIILHTFFSGNQGNYLHHKDTSIWKCFQTLDFTNFVPARPSTVVNNRPTTASPVCYPQRPALCTTQWAGGSCSTLIPCTMHIPTGLTGTLGLHRLRHPAVQKRYGSVEL